MSQFLISLLFFILVLACFWGVLHWVRYKKRENTCACGKGACLTDKHRGETGHSHSNHDDGPCNASDCKCDE
ncbi:MAG: hypothetical protein JXK94_13840 [Deltaproteobacteria bacterium]|nr:hypothetical protein [Deltaproteobacteria bacterium]